MTPVIGEADRSTRCSQHRAQRTPRTTRSSISAAPTHTRGRTRVTTSDRPGTWTASDERDAPGAAGQARRTCRTGRGKQERTPGTMFHISDSGYHQMVVARSLDGPDLTVDPGATASKDRGAAQGAGAPPGPDIFVSVGPGERRRMLDLPSGASPKTAQNVRSSANSSRHTMAQSLSVADAARARRRTGTSCRRDRRETAKSPSRRRLRSRSTQFGTCPTAGEHRQ
jgi:hypothetical protein